MQKRRLSFVLTFGVAVLTGLHGTGCRSVGDRPGTARGPMPDLQATVAALPMPAAGAHPRVLFTREALPAIRAQAQSLGGKATLSEVAWQADSPGKPVLENARAGRPEKAQNLTVHAFNHAFLYLVTEDPARLDNARALLDAWAAQHAAKHEFGDAWRDGYRFALCYDWLYDKLSPATRDAMRETMASGMTAEALHGWEHLGYLKGAIITGRPCDWGAIASGSMLMQWLAIAGEEPRASREFLSAIVELMQYIADLGITADGYMNAGNGYAAGDFVNYGYAVRALQVHGVPLVDHPHLQAFAEWLAYESIPGQYVFDNRSFSRGYHGGLAPLIVALAARHGGVAAWLADQGRGPDRTGAYGVPGVLWGAFSEVPVAPPGLPLARWISTMGISFSRGGWTDGSTFCLGMEPLVPGKTHSDKGSFTFYSHGQTFAADPGGGFPNSEDHQTILIDGKGQHNSGGMTATDAIPRGFLTSGLADLNHLDVRPAYERHIAYTRTQPGPVEFGKLEYGRGLPFRWEVFRPMQHAERYGLYVRGSVQPYVVILDDIQQDEKEHRHEWLMHSRTPADVAGPGHVRYQSRYGGGYVQAERNSRVSFTTDLPAAGEYTVYALVRKWPQLKNWFSHHVGLHVNGRGTYFRPGDYLDDWQWVTAGTNELRAGKNDVTVSGGRGLRVAQVAAVPGKDSPAPGRMRDSQFLGEAPAGTVVFQRQTELTKEDWSAHRDPCARMDLHFIQPGADGLALDFWRKPRAVPLALRAAQKTVRAGFAAVLIPYDDTDPAPSLVRTGPGAAVLTWGPYTDHLYADPAHAAPPNPDALFRTDGKFALVRTRDEAVVGYALVAGTTLAFRGQTLVAGGDGPLHVLHDGGTCVVQAPPGARGRLARLTAGTLVCNRETHTVGRGTTMEFRAPALAAKWKTRIRPDGRLVAVKGAGPLPLKIRAPQAVQCLVNDVSVWFTRDGAGHIFPKIELTELKHGREPLNSKPADAVPPAAAAAAAPSVVAEIPLPHDGWRFQRDPDDVGRTKRWFDIAFDDQAWSPIGIAAFWDSFGVKHTGFGWYRRAFALPERPAQAGKVELAFDAVDEMAWVWLNGELAGEYTEYGPAGWTEPFSFDVTRLVRWGAENQITVRSRFASSRPPRPSPDGMALTTGRETGPSGVKN